LLRVLLKSSDPTVPDFDASEFDFSGAILDLIAALRQQLPSQVLFGRGDFG